MFTISIVQTLTLAAVAASTHPPPPALQPVAAGEGVAEHEIYGVVRSIAGPRLVITNRFGRTLVVDLRSAHENLKLYPGRPVIVFGSFATNDAFRATAVWRTFPDAAHWPADR
jgi:hypothetical protein